MCGIAGIISTKKNIVTQSNLQLMANALQHRGPNGEGFFINEKGNLGFAHRRLSIIDLTQDASQPFHYLHYSVTYNGEIYNYLELKILLQQKKYTFKTNSDTEVLLAAYDCWGQDFLHHLDGMFTLAIYDHKTKYVFLARDVFGEKPLYFHLSQDKSSFYFASEMKALWCAGVDKIINNTSVLNYLALGIASNSSDRSSTFYKNISILQAGHSMLLNTENNELIIKEWRKKLFTEDKNISIEDAIINTSALLKNSIAKRLRSDVEVGTSLSGGLDSSAIVAFIHQQKNDSQYKANTFTASFPQFEQDETFYSKKVADTFSLHQFFTTPLATDFVNDFERLIYHQEEPMQSASVYTQFKVYQLAKEHHVTVLLDGQGADEIFGGYKKYGNWFLQELFFKNLLKFNKEKALLQAHEFLENWKYKNLLATLSPTLTKKALETRASKIITTNSFLNKDFLQDSYKKESLYKPTISNLNNLLHYNTYEYGLQELLRYADKNSMAHGREVRLPFLNKQLVEYIFSLGSHVKIKDGYTKWILRKAVENHLPNEIVWRKNKIGFEPPQNIWFRDKLVKEKINASREKLVNQNILDKRVLKKEIDNKNVHDKNNFDWYCLNIAEIL